MLLLVFVGTRRRSWNRSCSRNRTRRNRTRRTRRNRRTRRTRKKPNHSEAWPPSRHKTGTWKAGDETHSHRAAAKGFG